MLYSYLWLPLSSFEPCDEDEGVHSLGQTTPVKDLELHCSLSPHTPPSLPPPSFIWGTQALSNTSSPGLSIHQDTVHGRTEQVAALETTSRALKEQETTRKHSLALNYAAKEAYAPSARDSSDLKIETQGARRVESSSEGPNFVATVSAELMCAMQEKVLPQVVTKVLELMQHVLQKRIVEKGSMNQNPNLVSAFAAYAAELMGATQEKPKKDEKACGDGQSICNRVQWIVEKAVAAAKNELMEKMKTFKKKVEEKVKGVVVQAETLLRGAFHFVLLQGERWAQEELKLQSMRKQVPMEWRGSLRGIWHPEHNREEEHVQERD